MNDKILHIVIKYLNKEYGDLKEYTTDVYPNSKLYVKDKRAYMKLDYENGYLKVDYDTIWTDLINLFDLRIAEIQHVISKWVEEIYNIKGVTPMNLFGAWAIVVEETHNPLFFD